MEAPRDHKFSRFRILLIVNTILLLIITLIFISLAIFILPEISKMEHIMDVVQDMNTTITRVQEIPDVTWNFLTDLNQQEQSMHLITTGLNLLQDKNITQETGQLIQHIMKIPDVTWNFLNDKILQHKAIHYLDDFLYYLPNPTN